VQSQLHRFMLLRIALYTVANLARFTLAIAHFKRHLSDWKNRSSSSDS
jgi:hypothetical protein